MQIEGRFVKRERVALAYSVEYIARQCGVSRSDIQDIEQGIITDVPYAQVARIAALLGVTIDDLRKED